MMNNISCKIIFFCVQVFFIVGLHNFNIIIFIFCYGVLTMWSSSSSCCAISMNIPGPLLPHLPIIHCFRQILRATSSIDTELLYVGLSWTSCLYLSMWRGPQEYITYELIPTSPTVFHMSGSFNFDSFHDGW